MATLWRFSAAFVLWNFPPERIIEGKEEPRAGWRMEVLEAALGVVLISDGGHSLDC